MTALFCHDSAEASIRAIARQHFTHGLNRYTRIFKEEAAGTAEQTAEWYADEYAKLRALDAAGRLVRVGTVLTILPDSEYEEWAASLGDASGPGQDWDCNGPQF